MLKSVNLDGLMSAVFLFVEATTELVGAVPSVGTIAVSVVRENVAVVDPRENAIRVAQVRTAVVSGWRGARPIMPATTPTHLHGVGLFSAGLRSCRKTGERRRLCRSMRNR